MSEQQRVPVGVRFKEAGKIYYFDAGDLELEVGYYVVVETSHGLEVGRVVISQEQVIASEIKESLKPILRRATEEDLQRSRELKDRGAEQLHEAKRQAAEREMDMQLVSGDYNLDGSQLTLYFTASERVDFRQLSRDLSRDFDTKVQFLQVGERDRAKLADGYDVCGQRLCCSSWQTSFPSVSIKMAKDQDLPLNPQKISGVCGRLYCCLTFEVEAYRELRGQMPKVGSMVSTPAGEAKVNSVNVMKKTVTLWLTEQHQVMEMPAIELQMQYGLTVRPVELVREIEEPLKQAPETPAAEAAAPPEAPAPAPAPPESRPRAEGEQPRRRRRGRRGGRNRRPEGGERTERPQPPDGDGRPPGPPPGPPGPSGD
jgi:cell fate regulator YaaT (PSP1 superfamily)